MPSGPTERHKQANRITFHLPMSCDKLSTTPRRVYHGNEKVRGLGLRPSKDLTGQIILYHLNQFCRPLSRALWPWLKSGTACPLSPLKWPVTKFRKLLEISSWPKLTVAEIEYLSLVPWLVVGDRNPANLSRLPCPPPPPPAELIQMVQY